MRTARLRDVCEFKPSKRKLRSKLTESASVSFVPMNDLGIHQKYLIAREERPLSQVVGSYTYFAEGDVLLAKITPCFENGKLGIARGLTNGAGFGSSEFMVIRPGPEVLAEYIYHFLDRDELREHGAKAMTGAVGHKRVPQEFVEALEIPLPPVEEQRRIVAVLEQALAAVAIATANAEKNLANARELSAVCPAPDSATIKRHAIGELLERGWLTGHMDGNHGGDYPRKDEFVGAGVSYLSANCIRDGLVDFSRAKFLTGERAGKLRKGFAKNRDVLFAHNATVGPVALLQTNEDFVVLGTSLTYYRCNDEFILPEYLESYLRSAAFVEQYSAVMRQSTRNQVPITKQREFYIDVPSMEVQRRLVASLSGFQEDGRTLAKLYRAKLDALSALRKSILHRAFYESLSEREPLAA